MKKIETISITKQQSYALTAQGVLMLFIGVAIFRGIFGQSNQNAPAWALVAVYFATLIVHELVHGLGFLLSGAKPKFGVGFVGIMPFAYATSGSNSKIPLKKMLVTAYLPFVLLSIIFILLASAIPGYVSLLMVGFVGNFAGAIGDIWIASKLLKYLRYSDTLVVDTKSGVDVYSSSAQAAVIGAASMAKQKINTPFWRVACIAFVLIMAISALVPMIMSWSGFHGVFTLGAGVFYLFTIDTTGTNFMASFNLLPALVGGVLAGVLFTILEKRSRT